MEHISDELLQKAELLKQSSLFVDISGNGTTFGEKATLFLVLAGAKPVGEALSGHMERVGDWGRAVADDPEEVAEFLTSLGLYFDLADSDESVTQALVSLDADLINEYRQAGHNQETIGRLFGYPETAIRAFAAGPDMLLPSEEAHHRVAEAGFDPDILWYRLSKENWQKELAVATKWHELLIAVGLANKPSEQSIPL